YIIADVWPVVATAKVKKTQIYKITGVDLMDELLKLADKKKLNILFLGATDDTLKKLKYNIERDFNNINLINYNNGYFSEKENERIV
ncbi:WecB/TagA/CpsF family glycosyltransferase, partial [Clostridium perfringens]